MLLCISLTVGSYLQDGLIQQCGETMKENISTKTACGYYACASIYGLDSVMKKCDGITIKSILKLFPHLMCCLFL